jgi:tetratricopeptide (TPR) repeat protein
LLLHYGLDIDGRYPALMILLTMLLGLVYQPLIRRAPRSAQTLLLPLMMLAALALAVSNYLSAAANNRGQIYDDNHELDRAAQEYAHAHTGLMYNPDTLTAEGIDYYVLATVTNGSQRYQDQARNLAQRAIKLDSSDSQHYFLLGRVERLSGNLPAAEEAYDKAINLDRYNHPQYYLDLALTQAQRDNLSAARQTVDTALALYPQNVTANRNADPTIKPTIEELQKVHATLEKQP